MNPPAEEHIQRLSTCRGRFTGDPSHEFECKTYRIVGEGEEEHIEEEIVSIEFDDYFSPIKLKIVFFL